MHNSSRRTCFFCLSRISRRQEMKIHGLLSRQPLSSWNHHLESSSPRKLTVFSLNSKRARFSSIHQTSALAMSEVGNGSQTFDVESDEDESLRQENDEEESQDGSDEDEDFEDDGEAGNFEVSGTDEDEESEDRGEADRYEELHCYRCKAELNVNCTTDIITYCRTCVDDNCKEMSTLGSSVAENLKTVALLKEQLAKVTQAVAGLRYQLTTKQAETQRLNMKLKVAKLEARDAKRHLREALASRRRPLQRPSSKAPPC